jgi:large subunit ribosomal protein L13
MSMTHTTHSANPADINRKWFIVDATDKPLGRLASQVASILRGKHTPLYTKHCDTGDYVVIINADKVRLTGNKLDTKFYYRHSGIPGGFKAEAYRLLMDRKPEFVIEKAVKGMLPKTPLGRDMNAKLKVYAGATHPHAAQKPTALTLA